MTADLLQRVAVQWIRLASDEWGSHLMDQIAAETFDKYEGDKSRLLLEVHEHAGWYLSYAFIGGRVRCVSSANDRAVFSDEVKSFWKMYNATETTILPTIRRGEEKE